MDRNFSPHGLKAHRLVWEFANGQAVPEKRFWSKYQKGAKEDDCWLWTGTLDSDGYGWQRWRALSPHGLKAHRLAWEFANGQAVPEGKIVMHSCDVRPCGNPRHLVLGTQADNQRDMSRKGRNHNSVKTHCKQGHEFTPENTYIKPGNLARACRICIRERTADWQKRQREMP